MFSLGDAASSCREAFKPSAKSENAALGINLFNKGESFIDEKNALRFFTNLVKKDSTWFLAGGPSLKGEDLASCKSLTPTWSATHSSKQQLVC